MMRKWLLLIGLFCFVVFVMASKVSANEGRLTMVRGSVQCEGLSIWKDDSYKIMGRCNGLVYPYAERLDRYVLWIQPENEETSVRLDDVDRGQFQGSTNKRFSKIFITAEETSSPSVPSTVVVVEAGPAGFQFRPSDGSVVGAMPEPKLPQGTPAVISPTTKPDMVIDTKALQNVSKGRSPVVPLILIGVLVVIVIGTVFFFRR